MEKFAQGLGVGILAIMGTVLLVALECFMGAAFGALTAIITAWNFPNTMAILLSYTHFAAVYQLGAALGFIGGFLRTTMSVPKPN